MGRNHENRITSISVGGLRAVPLARDGKRCSDGRTADTSISDLPNVRRRATETHDQRPAWPGADAGDGLILWAASPPGTPPETIIRILNKYSRNQGQLLTTHVDDQGNNCGLLAAAANPQLRHGFRLTDRSAAEYVATMEEMAKSGEIRIESHVVKGPHNEFAAVDVYSNNFTVTSDVPIFRRDVNERLRALDELAAFARQEGLEVDRDAMHAIAAIHDETVLQVVMGGKPGFAVNIRPGQLDVHPLGRISRRRP